MILDDTDLFHVQGSLSGIEIDLSDNLLSHQFQLARLEFQCKPQIAVLYFGLRISWDSFDNVQSPISLQIISQQKYLGNTCLNLSISKMRCENRYRLEEVKNSSLGLISE